MMRYKQINIIELNEKLKFDRRIKFLSDPSEYTGVFQKYLWECLTCGHIWKTTYTSVINGRKTGCPKCGYKKMGKTHSLIFDEITLNEKLKERNLFLLPNQQLNNSQTKVLWKCLRCQLIWYATYSSIIYNKTGCPACADEKHSREISGKNHPNWNGGYSRKDYPPEFNNSKKEFIRNRDNRKCQYPECNYDDTKEKRKLHVHHIDGDKKNCEDWNLISLCTSHHSKMLKYGKQFEDYFYIITKSYIL